MDLKKTSMGIEFGSTRIKAVLIDPAGTVLASGDHTWQDRPENGIWTYHMDDVRNGMQDAYANLAADVREKYGMTLTTVGAMGISAMMHGYIPFDKDGKQLAGFRTWRNTITGEAAAALTEMLHFNIPQRWTVAHLYQAILNGETHVKDIDYLTTLGGYVHWQLTGCKVIGVGEASGIFPIDSSTCDYDADMVKKTDGLLKAHGLSYGLKDIFPRVLKAGENAGFLTEAGARRLDPTGTLQAGIPLCPPEGDAGTGMAATNAVAPRTGNVSAGTSVFSMVVLEKPLAEVHTELDLVTTPSGAPVAMVHCNTCTSDLNEWIRLLSGAFTAAGHPIDTGELFTLFFNAALEGDPDCGGLVNVNYFSGEPVTGVEDGRPMFVRRPDAPITFANFARAQIYSAIATLKIGNDILAEEGVQVDRLTGHGGLFKTPLVGQRFLAGALNAPVSVMETAGEGGPWGMALLAAYLLHKEDGESLEEYLNHKIFKDAEASTIEPEKEDADGFNVYIQNFRQALAAEKAAVEAMK